MAILAGLAARLAACGSGGGGADADVAQVDDAAGDEAEAELVKVPVQVTEDFRVVYGYQGRIAGPTGNSGQHDLRIADPRDADPANDLPLTKPALAALDPDLTCSLGCFVDRGLRWLAVVTGPVTRGSSAYTVRVARLGADLSADWTVVPPIDGARHVEMSSDAIWWTSPQPDCQADRGPPSTCYAVRKIEFATPTVVKTLTSFPGPDALAGSQYQGWFTLGEDGASVILLNPTNVSETVYVWRDGKLSKVGDPICAAPDPGGVPGKCGTGGTGSQFKDNHPAALSADGRHLVYALLVENTELRLYHDDLVTGSRTYSVLLAVANGYTVNACYNIADWQYKDVLPPIRFSPDGEEVILIGSSDCGPNKDKPWTNLVRLALGRIGTGEKLTADDLGLITDHPKGAVAKCVTISSFDLSPTGEFLTFLGTPTLESDGKTAIKDTDVRGRSSAEVYVTRTDGAAIPVQVTNSLEWKATSVLAVPAPL
jgi:hypothetical protein